MSNYWTVNEALGKIEWEGGLYETITSVCDIAFDPEKYPELSEMMERYSRLARELRDLEYDLDAMIEEEAGNEEESNI